MKYVMPIEDKNMVGIIADYFLEKNERDYVLFMTGVYLGRRISDILQYRVRDLRDKDHISIQEQKTGKTILLPINPHLQKIYKEFFKGKNGYKVSLSCHTLRKTFGYWLYVNSGGDIVMVQELLGHSSAAYTRRYIGIDQQKKEKAVNELKF